MSDIDTNEYLKRLQERLNKLQKQDTDLGKTQIIPKIQDISEYKDNSHEVERWREKKNGSISQNSTASENNISTNNGTFMSEEKQESSVLTEEKTDPVSEEQLDKEELLEREREQIAKENQAFLDRLNAKSKEANLHKEEFLSSDKNSNIIVDNGYTNNEEYDISQKHKNDYEDEFEERYSNKRNNQNDLKKPQKKWKKVLKVLFIIAFVLTWLVSIGLFIFFKTPLLQYHKELWVQTAMTTMNHQYLATWFMSDEEINKIMKDMEVENNEDSILHEVELPAKTPENKPKENVIKVDKITGDNYVGFVMSISDPSKLKLVDARKKGIGTKLSEICKKNNAIAGINAGGFVDPDGHGDGDQLTEPTIINKELQYGRKNEISSWIGLTEEGELVLGKYTYQEAIDIGIVSGLQFGPYIIVNVHNQITKSNAGGLHPRMAIGQKKDGTILFVCIDGRQPGYSVGTTLLELQKIFERYGAYNAANLDGGSSATMYYDGKVVNKTSTPIGERYLPNAFIIEK